MWLHKRAKIDGSLLQDYYWYRGSYSPNCLRSYVVGSAVRTDEVTGTFTTSSPEVKSVNCPCVRWNRDYVLLLSLELTNYLTLGDSFLITKRIFFHQTSSVWADNKACSKLRSFIEAPVLRSVPGRYNRHCISPQSLYGREAPNHRSLQSEMQDMQQVGSAGGPRVAFSRCWHRVLHCPLYLQHHHRALDDISLPSLHTHGDDIQSIIHRIKSVEIVHRLHNKYSERVRTTRRCSAEAN